MPEEDLFSSPQRTGGRGTQDMMMAQERSQPFFSNLNNQSFEDEILIGKRKMDDQLCFDQTDNHYKINQELSTQKYLKFKDFKFTHQTVDFLKNNQDIIMAKEK